MKKPSELALGASLKLLLPQDAPVSAQNCDALAVAPMAYWLLDTLDPGRILTVGAAGELLHLIMGETADQQGMKVACFHMARDLTDGFSDARMRHDAVRSQLLTPNATAPRMGAEGQFDLIILHVSGAPEPQMVEEWRNGLSPSGVLTLHCVNCDTPENTGAMATWSIGAETLALFWNPNAPQDIQDLAAATPDRSEAHQTLGGVLAASVAALTIRRQRRSEDRFQSQLEALQKRHQSDLILLTTKLAEIEDQNASHRAAVKEANEALRKATERV